MIDILSVHMIASKNNNGLIILENIYAKLVLRKYFSYDTYLVPTT